MGQKLWLKIFTLLLLGLTALASPDNETSPENTTAPEIPAAPTLTLTLGTSGTTTPRPESGTTTPESGTTTPGPESGLSLDESLQVNVSNNNTEAGPSSDFTNTTEEEPLTLSNGTSLTNSSEIHDTNNTVSGEATPLPVPETQTSATQSPQKTTSTTLISGNKTETLPPSPTSPSHLEISNTSQSLAPVHTIAPTPELTPPSTTSSTTTTTITSTTSTTTSTTVSSTSTTTTTTAQQSTKAPAVKDLTTHLGSSAVKAVSPSQLNVGKETSVVHEGPTLDPLLAGLVSAFIIAAVIITLLLFLKLRRRDSRPEFRRLQDLPMDDMMEDTPLSMYSY